MQEKKKEQYKKLRENGWTYKRIADEFRVSHQAIHSCLNYMYRYKANGKSPNSNIPYNKTT